LGKPFISLKLMELRRSNLTRRWPRTIIQTQCRIFTVSGWLRQSCRTRVLDLESSRTRVRFSADLDLDSVGKDSGLDLDITCLQTTAAQLSYLNLCAQQQTPDICLIFWSHHERDLNKLHQLAMSVLSVPATSAAVERVFSHGGSMSH